MIRNAHFYLLLTLLVGAVCYGLGVGDFLLFDSLHGLGENAYLQALAAEGSFANWLLAIDSSNSGPTGRLVAMFTFAVESWIYSEVWAAGFKYTNISLHLLIALVAYGFLTALLAGLVSRGMIVCAVAIWLLHPLQVSTVLYTIQRMAQLSALFTLIGLWIFVHYRGQWLERRATVKELSNGCFALFLALVFAVYSKESGILLLPLLVLVECVFFKGRYNAHSRVISPAILWCALAVPFAMLLILAVVPPTWLLDMYDPRAFSIEERGWTQLRVVWQYLSWFFVPDIRQLGIHHDDISLSTSWLNPVSTLVAAIGWLLLPVLIYLLRSHRAAASFSMAWFVICHILESTLLPLELVYEHRNYLALLGPALGVAYLFWQIENPRLRHALAATTVVALAIQLLSRTTLWQEEMQFASYQRHHHQQSYRSNYHYANALLRLGEATSDSTEQALRLESARQAYIDSLAIEPDSLVSLVTLLYLDGRYFSFYESDRWLSQLHQAVSIRNLDASDPGAMDALLQCIQLAYCDQEITDFPKLAGRLVERYPQQPIYRHQLAAYLGGVEQNYEAAVLASKALVEAHPQFRDGYFGLYSGYVAQGEAGQALLALRDMFKRHRTLKTLVKLGSEQAVEAAP